MKRFFTTQKFRLIMGLLLILIGQASQAQVGQGYFNTTKWRFSDPKQFGFTVLDVQFYDNNFGIAVGASGGIARTNNGGTNWTYGPFTFIAPSGLQASGSFNDVHIASPTTAYAVGSNGMMAKTTDGGQNWNFVVTPLFGGAKNINAVWFVNKDTGYIGGAWNSIDSIPKVYVTKNGGTTWDSLAAPIGGKTRVGYVNNPNLAPILWDVTGKGKEIHRIIFTSPTMGYIVGSGQTHFPPVPAANATTCLPTGATTTTSANNAALVWKFSNGVLSDYSLSKEKLGYSGINTNTVNCTTSYNAAQVAPVVQTYKAANIINDSLLLIMSFNNNTVVRINTGRNDSTLNLATGLKEPGRFEIMNFPFPPTQGPQAGTPIPATQVLLASNPYHIKKAANGKLYAGANLGNLWTSVDTGRNWRRENALPQGQTYSSFATWALDFLPNGKLVTMGQGGVVADSIPGGSFNSTYVYVGSGGSKVDFLDCNNGIITGGSGIAVTTNGGNSWVAKNRPDFAASFYSINGFHYTSLNKSYFAVSNGIVYVSPDQATTLDPYFTDFNFQMNDVKGFGNDTTYALGYSQFSVPAASRRSAFFRSVNAGATWQTVDIVATTTTPAFTAPTLSKMAFPSRNVGYAAGSRNGVYKTINGGTTWTSINPFPALNENVGGSFTSYTSIFALDDNTVFVLGNIFTTAGFKRLYKTTDGGATWTDISSNMNTLLPSGNMLNVLFHDANNGYVCGSNVLFITNNGGTTWTMEIPPEGNLHNAMGFAPRTVPAAIPFANRKLFIGVLTAGNNIPTIMEFGDTLNVNVNANLVATNATCTNLTAGAITVNASGGLAPYTYSINGGTFQSSNIFSGLTQGVKTITVKDAFCGTQTKTVTIGFTNDLTLSVAPTDTSVCAGAPVQFRTTSNAATYSWAPAAGLSNNSIANPIAIVNSNSSYTVTASLNGCVKTATANITIKANPVISAGPDKTIVDGATVQLEGSGSSNALSIAWTPAATLTSANTYMPYATPSTTTTYSLTVKDNNGCTSIDDATVTVIPYCVKIMNAFTPNGDGINDKWIVTTGAACTNQVMVKVFNRYGGEVYTNDNYQNNWDGTYKGKPVPDGTYYYVISFKLISGRIVPAKGDVTILR